jgi:hypothetical protein
MDDLVVIKTTDNKYYWACYICGVTGETTLHDQYIHAEDFGRIHMHHNHGTERPVLSFENKPVIISMTDDKINDFVRRLRLANNKILSAHAPYFAALDIEKICQEMELLTLDPKYR